MVVVVRVVFLDMRVILFSLVGSVGLLIRRLCVVMSVVVWGFLVRFVVVRIMWWGVCVMNVLMVFFI